MRMTLSVGIEEDYKGPRFEDGGVTLSFVQDLMKTFKDQKKLHRKYAYQVRTQQANIAISDVFLNKKVTKFY